MNRRQLLPPDFSPDLGVGAGYTPSEEQIAAGMQTQDAELAQYEAMLAQEQELHRRSSTGASAFKDPQDEGVFGQKFQQGLNDSSARGQIHAELLGAGRIDLADKLTKSWDANDKLKNGGAEILPFDEWSRNQQIAAGKTLAEINADAQDPFKRKLAARDYVASVEADPQFEADKKGGALARQKAVVNARSSLMQKFGDDVFAFDESDKRREAGLKNGFLGNAFSRLVGEAEKGPAELVAAAANYNPARKLAALLGVESAKDGITPTDIPLLGRLYNEGEGDSQEVSQSQRDADEAAAAAYAKGDWAEVARQGLGGGLAGNVGSTLGFLLGGLGEGAVLRAGGKAAAKLGAKVAGKTATEAAGKVTGKVAESLESAAAKIEGTVPGLAGEALAGSVRALNPATKAGSSLLALNLQDAGGQTQQNYEANMALPDAEFAQRFPEYNGTPASRESIARQHATEQGRGLAVLAAQQMLLGMGGVEKSAINLLTGAGRAGATTDGLLLRGAKGFAKGGAEEFLQETGQESVNALAGQDAQGQQLDPELALRQGLGGGLVGAALGGVLGAGTGAFRGRQAQASPTSEVPPAAEVAPAAPAAPAAPGTQLVPVDVPVTQTRAPGAERAPEDIIDGEFTQVPPALTSLDLAGQRAGAKAARDVQRAARQAEAEKAAGIAAVRQRREELRQQAGKPSTRTPTGTVSPIFDTPTASGTGFENDNGEQVEDRINQRLISDLRAKIEPEYQKLVATAEKLPTPVERLAARKRMAELRRLRTDDKAALAAAEKDAVRKPDEAAGTTAVPEAAEAPKKNQPQEVAQQPIGQPQAKPRPEVVDAPVADRSGAATSPDPSAGAEAGRAPGAAASAAAARPAGAVAASDPVSDAGGKPAAALKRKPAPRKPTSVDYAESIRKALIATIIANGGINQREMADVTGNGRRNQKTGAVHTKAGGLSRRMFTKSGVEIDRLREFFGEQGYFPDDGDVTGDASAVRDILRSLIDNEPDGFLSPEQLEEYGEQRIAEKVTSDEEEYHREVQRLVEEFGQYAMEEYQAATKDYDLLDENSPEDAELVYTLQEAAEHLSDEQIDAISQESDTDRQLIENLNQAIANENQEVGSGARSEQEAAAEEFRLQAQTKEDLRAKAEREAAPAVEPAADFRLGPEAISEEESAAQLRAEARANQRDLLGGQGAAAQEAADADRARRAAAAPDASVGGGLFGGRQRRSGRATGPSISMDDLRAAAAGYDTETHATVDDLRKAVNDPTLDADTQGYFDANTGKIHLVAANIRDAAEANVVLDHELVGHKGLRALFSRAAWGRFLADVLKNAEVKRLADAWRQANPQGTEQEATEEALAQLAEKPAENRDLLQRIIDKVREFARRVGIVSGYSDADVRSLLAAARAQTRLGAGVDSHVKYDEAAGEYIVTGRDGTTRRQKDKPGRPRKQQELTETTWERLIRKAADVRAPLRKASQAVMPYFERLRGASDAEKDRLRQELNQAYEDLMGAPMSEAMSDMLRDGKLSDFNLELRRDLASAAAKHDALEILGPREQALNKIKNEFMQATGLTDEKEALRQLADYLDARHASERNKVFRWLHAEFASKTAREARDTMRSEFEADMAEMRPVNGVFTDAAKARIKQYRGDLEALYEANKDAATDEKIYAQYSDKQAAEVAREFESKTTPELRAHLEAWRKGLADKTVEIGRQSGRWGPRADIAREVYGFENYVPLKGWDREADPDAPGFGEFTSGLAAPIIKAEGRESFAANSIAQMLADARRGVQDIKDREIAFAAVMQQLAPGNTLVANVQRRSIADTQLPSENAVWFHNGDDTVTYVEYGARRSKDENGNTSKRVDGADGDYARLVANGLKGIVPKASPALRTFEKYATRPFGRLKTYFNPDFWFAGAARDIGQFAAIAMLEHPEFTAGVAAQYSQRVAAAYKSRRTWQFMTALSSNDAAKLDALANGPDGAFFKSAIDFSKRGGMTSLNQILGNEQTFEALLEGSAAPAAVKFRQANKFLDDMNASLEGATRIAMYQTLTEDLGWDQDEAAGYVKNMTNYELSGELGQTLGAVYAFFRPNATGVNRLIQAMKTNPEQAMKMAAVFAAMGALAVGLSYGLSGDDEDGNNKALQDDSGRWTRGFRFLIPNSDKVAVLPLPYGVGSFFAAGAQVALLGGGTSGDLARRSKEFLDNMAEIGVDSFSPVPQSKMSLTGDPVSWMVDTLAPSVFKPAIGWTANKNAFGEDIYTEWGFGKVPSDAYYGQTKFRGSMYDRLARFAYDSTGGAIDVAPGSLDHIVSNYLTPLDAVQDMLFAKDPTAALTTSVGGFASSQRDIASTRWFRMQSEVESLYKRRDVLKAIGGEKLTEFDAANPGVEEAHEKLRDYANDIDKSYKRAAALRFEDDGGKRKRDQEREDQVRHDLRRKAYQEAELKPWGD